MQNKRITISSGRNSARKAGNGAVVSSTHYTATSRVKAQLRAASCAILLASLSACSGLQVPQFPGVYKIAIAQGNIITQEMIDQLEPGMTRRQVIFVMGSPLVRDPYSQDRWDYVFNYQPGGGVRGQERVTLMFENEQLVSLSGDFEPGPESAWFDTSDADAADSNS